MAQGGPGRLRPRIFLTFRHYKAGNSSAKRTGRLYPRRNPWYSLSEAESNSGHMVLLGVPRKKSPVTPPGIDPWTLRLVMGAVIDHRKLLHLVNYFYVFQNSILTNVTNQVQLRDVYSMVRNWLNILSKDARDIYR